jgi:hypothetical protein
MLVAVVSRGKPQFLGVICFGPALVSVPADAAERGVAAPWVASRVIAVTVVPRDQAVCRRLSYPVASRWFLAMQKVVGSSPIIRSQKSLAVCGAFVSLRCLRW